VHLAPGETILIHGGAAYLESNVAALATDGRLVVIGCCSSWPEHAAKSP